ncbi:MAG TPA: sigma-70 family RNA polymerase sigma factor [Polyangiales bacterium]|nr:sigma-70 family RNA polymerase sigma factor [Polyangiales bacterium]
MMPQHLRKAPVRRFPQERLSDAELVHAIVQGDGDAVGVVWDRYSMLVRSVLRSSLGFDADVEDLLQEVFIAFLRGVHRLRSAESLRAYLVGVAVRRVMGELRRRRVRRWMTLLPSDEIGEVHAAVDDVEGSQVLRALDRILDRMPARRRMAFVLRHVQGCEVSEAAAMLGVSESTVKREARRARASIEMRAAQSEPWLWDYLQRLESVEHD